MSLITSTTGCCSCGATYYAYPCWASSSHYFDATTQAPFGDPPNSPRRDDSVYNVNFNGECPSDFPPPAGTDIIVMLRGAGGGSSPVFPIAGGGGGATIEFQTKVDTSLKVLVGRGGQYSIAAFFPAFTNTWGGGGLGAWGNIGFNTFGYSNGGGASGIQIGEDDFSIIYVAGAGGGAGTPGSGFAGGAGGLELGGDGGGREQPSWKHPGVHVGALDDFPDWPDMPPGNESQQQPHSSHHGTLLIAGNNNIRMIIITLPLLIVIIYEPYRLQSEVIILIFMIAHYC